MLRNYAALLLLYVRLYRYATKTNFLSFYLHLIANPLGFLIFGSKSPHRSR